MTTLTVEQVAQRLHCSAYTVRKHISEGNLRASKVAKRWLVSEDDLALWLEENANRAPHRRRRRRAA